MNSCLNFVTYFPEISRFHLKLWCVSWVLSKPPAESGWVCEVLGDRSREGRSPAQARRKKRVPRIYENNLSRHVIISALAIRPLDTEGPLFKKYVSLGFHGDGRVFIRLLEMKRTPCRRGRRGWRAELW